MSLLFETTCYKKEKLSKNTNWLVSMATNQNNRYSLEDTNSPVTLLIFMIERSFKVPFRTLWKFYHLECLNQLSWLFGYHGNRKTMRNSHYFAFLTLLPCSFVNMHDRKTIQSFFSKTLGVLPSRVLKLVFMFTWLPW